MTTQRIFDTSDTIVVDDTTGELRFNRLAGVDLATLVTRLRTERQRIEDFVVPASRVSLDDDARVVIRDVPGLTDDTITETWGGGLDAEARRILRTSRLAHSYDGLPLFHGQLCTRLAGVGWKRYYDALREADPAMLAQNVNFWLRRDDEQRSFLLRTLRPWWGGPGIARACLSDQYFVINHLDVITTVLSTVDDLGLTTETEVTRCDLTESRMWIQLRFPSVAIDAGRMLAPYRPGLGRDGDQRLVAGLTITNSEVGGGAYAIQPTPSAPVCMNRFPQAADMLRRVHVGGKLTEGVVTWSRDTQRKAFDLMLAQCRDAVRSFCSTEYLHTIEGRILTKLGFEVEHKAATVRRAASLFAFDEAETDRLLEHFLGHGDQRGTGVLQAVTLEISRMDDPDRMYEAENVLPSLIDKLHTFDRPLN